MSIWKQTADLDRINALERGLACVEHLGMRVTEIGDDYLRGTMPVDARTQAAVRPAARRRVGGAGRNARQPRRQDVPRCRRSEMAVGLDINANHVRAVTDGVVTGTARPLHLGRNTQVWEIRIEDERGKLVCISRLTLAVVPRQIAETPV